MSQTVGCIGWPPSDEVAAAVERMAAGSAAAPVIRVGDRAAIAGGVSAGDGEIFATILGMPRWRDPALVCLAAERGDAAALLLSFQQNGLDLFRHLAGSFALAVIEPARRRALLAVDRMGIETLAFAPFAGEGLAFGSSATAVCRHPRVRTRLSAQSLFNYTFFHMVPSPATIFAGVRKLEPAQYLWWQDGKLTLARYWEPTFTSVASVDERELAVELRSRLDAAVERCAPDDTTGAFLSGGLDSSTVTGVFAGLVRRPVRTYSIGFEQSGYDELEYARIAARHFQAMPGEYYVQHRDVEAAIPQIAAAYDEPFGNSSAVPTLLCARLARRDGMTALLAGDGGDEIFGGNERYARQQVFDLYWRIPRALRRGLVEPLCLPLACVPGLSKLSSYVAQARVPMPMRLQTYNFLYRTSAAEMFEPGFLGGVDLDQPRELLERTWQQAPTDSLVDRMLYLDWKFTLADNDLHKVRRMCELARMRVAFPFLDDELVEFSTRLPAAWKVRNGTLRYFYKRALTGFLPDPVIAKTKHGFGLPFGEWLKQSPPLQASVYDSLEALKRRAILRPAFIDRLVREHRSGHAAYFGTMVWVLVMLEQWLAHHPAEDTIAA